MPNKQPPCGVCGQSCLTDVGTFKLPVPDPLFGQPIGGPCCSICGPKVEVFVEGKCADFTLIPDGPLKTILQRLNRLYMGLRCLEAAGWLAENCARVHFRHSGMVVGEPADEVAVSVGGQTGVAPTLEGAIDALVTAK